MKKISLLFCLVCLCAFAVTGCANKFSADRFNTETVHFQTGKYVLTPEAKSVLDYKIAYLKHYVGAEVFVVGFADVRSDDKFNMNLGFLRSEEVYRYFVENGISPHRVRIMTDGKRYATVKGGSDSAMLVDRKVECTLTTPAGFTTTP